VSNCHDEHDARDDFRVRHKILAPSEPPYGFLTTGARLSREERQRLDERVAAATSVDDFVTAYVNAVREIAARDATVSKNVLAVTIPRAAVRPDGDVMVVMGAPLTLDRLASVYFPEDESDPISVWPELCLGRNRVDRREGRAVVMQSQRRTPLTSPSARAGPRCRGGRRRCTRQGVRDGLFSSAIDVADRPEGQPSRPCLCPSPNPPPAFGSAPARKLLSYPIPTRAVTNFRGLADCSLLTRTPTRTRRGPSQPR
jgi:hypothetical protein